MARLIPPEVVTALQAAFVHFSAPEGHAHLELEARFQNVSEDGFRRVIEQFAQRSKDMTVTRMIDTSIDLPGARGTLRRSVRSSSSREEEVVWEIKKKEWMYDLVEAGVRLALSRETPLPDGPAESDRALFMKTEKTNVVRDKHRTSIPIFNGQMILDATETRQHLPGHIPTTSYELEIELAQATRPTTQQLDLLAKAIYLILARVQDSDIPIMKTEREQIYKYIGALTLENAAEASTERMPDKILVQARDLKMRDMVDGGLVGGSTLYTVTVKADGVRTLLAFTKWGVYFARPPLYLCKISSTRIPLLEGTILDGEYIPKAHRRGGIPAEITHYWLGFDCLADRGDTTIREKSHRDRLEACQRVSSPGTDLLALPKVLLNTKAFWALSDPATFFDRMAALLSSFDLLPYDQDGLMFTPNNAPYKTQGPGLSLGSRVLTRYTDICKWKPFELHTIDFGIAIVPATSKSAAQYPIKLMVTGKGGELIEWKGSERIPFTTPTSESIDWTTPFFSLTSLPKHGSIYEFRWDPDHQRLVPHRERKDKQRPNFVDIADDVWDNLHDPITKETLLGATFRQLRKYHNDIKRRVIDLVSPAKRVLDIGSGNGGDIDKWSRFQEVVAIEPDAAHRAEFMRRLSEKKGHYRTQVTLYEGTGQNALEVVPAALHGTFDSVTCMLSLSFLFKDRATLDAFAGTLIGALKPTGRMAFMTINGDAVKTMFAPAPALGHPVAPFIPQWKTPGMRLVYDPAKEQVEIHIPDSIVEHQVEWLVDMDLLVERLNALDPISDWTVSVHERTTGVQFLPTDSLVLNKLYSYGILQRTEVVGGKKAASIRVAVGEEKTKSPKKPRATEAEPEEKAASKKTRATAEPKPSAPEAAASKEKAASKKTRATAEPKPSAREAVASKTSPKKAPTSLQWTFEQDTQGRIRATEQTVAPTDPVLFYVLTATSPTFQTFDRPADALARMAEIRSEAETLSHLPTDTGPILPGHPLWNVIWTLLGVNVALTGPEEGETWVVNDAAFPTVTVSLTGHPAVMGRPTETGLVLLREA